MVIERDPQLFAVFNECLHHLFSILGGQRILDDRRKLMFSSVHLLGASHTAVHAMNSCLKWGAGDRSRSEESVRAILL